jgi:hypothetical protein
MFTGTRALGLSYHFSPFSGCATNFSSIYDHQRMRYECGRVTNVPFAAGGRLQGTQKSKQRLEKFLSERKNDQLCFVFIGSQRGKEKVSPVI